MRHTFSNREVFHIFFHRQEGQDYAKGSGSCSWKDNICYSYSSELGYADFENRIFYFRGGSRSSSTGKHQSYLLQAIPNDEWYVVTIDWWDWERGWDKSPSLNKWVNSKILDVKNDKYYLIKGTKNFGNPLYFNSTISKVQEVLSNCGQMNLYQPFLDEIEQYRWTQEELKIHEVKTWCLENGITGSYETKLKVYNNPELAKEVIEKNRIKKERLEANKEERQQKAIQKNIEKWYNGEVRDIKFLVSDRRTRYGSYNNPVYLRINPYDANEVETSKGAKVTLQKAKLLYYKFKKCIAENKEWHTNGETFSLGYYNVNSISKHYNGQWYIKAGCHQVFDTQIEEFVNRFTDWNNG